MNSPIEIVDETASTQDDALRLPPVKEPRVLVARVQTAGRGRTGPFRYFPDQFCASFVFPLNEATVNAAETATVLALVEILREREPDQAFEVSYPNDVLRNGRKAAGVLAEARANLVVGVGLNRGACAPEFGATRVKTPLISLASDLLNRICKNLRDPGVHARFYAEMRERGLVVERGGERFRIVGLLPPCLLLVRRLGGGGRFWAASLRDFEPRALE